MSEIIISLFDSFFAFACNAKDFVRTFGFYSLFFYTAFLEGLAKVVIAFECNAKIFYFSFLSLLLDRLLKIFCLRYISRYPRNVWPGSNFFPWTHWEMFFEMYCWLLFQTRVASTFTHFLSEFFVKALKLHRTAWKISAHRHSNIYLQLCMEDDYQVFLIASLVTTRQLLDENYYLFKLPFDWLMMWWNVNLCLLDYLILDFVVANLKR